MNMSKTAALKEASRAVSVSGRGTSWHIYGPWRIGELDGPSTSTTACSYWEAMGKAAVWKAQIALTLMGLDADEIDTDIYRGEPLNTRDLVTRAVARTKA